MGRIHKMILGGLDLRRYSIPRGYLYSFVVDHVVHEFARLSIRQSIMGQLRMSYILRFLLPPIKTVIIR